MTCHYIFNLFNCNLKLDPFIEHLRKNSKLKSYQIIKSNNESGSLLIDIYYISSVSNMNKVLEHIIIKSNHKISNEIEIKQNAILCVILPFY